MNLVLESAVASIQNSGMPPKTQSNLKFFGRYLLVNSPTKILWDWWISSSRAILYVYHLSYLPCPGRPPRKAPQDTSWYLGAWEREGPWWVWDVVMVKQFFISGGYKRDRGRNDSWKASEISKSPGFADIFVFFAPNRFDLMTRNEYFPKSFAN